MWSRGRFEVEMVFARFTEIWWNLWLEESIVDRDFGGIWAFKVSKYDWWFLSTKEYFYSLLSLFFCPTVHLVSRAAVGFERIEYRGSATGRTARGKRFANFRIFKRGDTRGALHIKLFTIEFIKGALNPLSTKGMPVSFVIPSARRPMNVSLRFRFPCIIRRKLWSWWLPAVCECNVTIYYFVVSQLKKCHWPDRIIHSGVEWIYSLRRDNVPAGQLLTLWNPNHDISFNQQHHYQSNTYSSTTTLTSNSKYSHNNP